MPISRIKTDGIQDDAITSAKIGVDVIVADDLAANSVTVSELTNGAVTGAKLADNLNYDSGTLYLDSTNNRVGIGTASPSETLHVEEATTGNAVRVARGGNYIIMGGSGSGTQYVKGYEASVAFGNAFAGNTLFLTNDTERMRIDSSGKVGIGGAASVPLHIQSSGQNANIRLQASDNGYASILQLYANNVSGASYNAIQSHVNGDGTVQWEISGPKASAEDQMLFHTGGTERMRIDSSGNVGIGSSGPTSLLTLQSTTSTKLNIRHTSSGNGYGYILRTTGSTTNDLIIESEFNGTATERMRIDSSGNVGIGTNSPNNQLEIKSTTNGDGIRLSNDVGSYYHLVRSNGDGLLFDADAGNTGGGGADIRFQIKGAEYMRLNANENLLIGTTTQDRGRITVHRNTNGSATPTVYFSNDGSSGVFASFGNTSGTVIGTITRSGSSTAYNTSSDYRLKDNVTSDWEATTRLKQLNPVRFNFITNTDTTVDGFLAHEVQSVVPEAISGTKDAVDADGNPEYQGIDQSKLVPLLVKTIQELEARITALESN